MPRTKPDAAELRTGQRVSRKDTGELGTVVEADGEVKVKWDSGRTSYYRRKKPAKIELVEK